MTTAERRLGGAGGGAAAAADEGAGDGDGGPEPFVVELERFHGPLDLLLHLIRSQDIDIFDIPIARITEQFQAALSTGLERLELDRAGEFLEMASTLVRIKAQLLIPRNESPDWEEDPRADLVRRLLEYEHFQEAAQVLMSAEADRSRHFAKGYVPRIPDTAPPVEELELTLDDLLEAARGVPEPAEEAVHRAPTRRVRVSEKISLARRLLEKSERVPLVRLYGPWNDRYHGVAGLLGCLEMARRQSVRVRQAEPFAQVWLYRGEQFRETGEDDEAGGGAPEGGRLARDPAESEGGSDG